MKMDFNMSCVCLLVLLIIKAEADPNKIFNVMQYGAVPDGIADSSQALMTAWSKACECKGGGSVLIPQGTFMVRPVEFKGPCNGPINFQIKGYLKAATDPATLDVDWIHFEDVDGLTVSGGGKLDGQGSFAWGNKCKKTGNCKPFPVSLYFASVTNSKIQDITSINSKLFHFDIFESTNIDISGVAIFAPEDSPNTDGIHISKSSYVRISHSQIHTGDDCISIIRGSKYINISNVLCGPGHGISVGSLGKFEDEGDVVGLTVRNCTFRGTDNGPRIKTWAPSLPSMAANFTFENILLQDVKNPIVIDQRYCPNGNCNAKGDPSQVQIRDVRFINIRGTSRSEVAVDLQCSSKVPCQNIELKDIDIFYKGEGKGASAATSSCSNVRGVAFGVQHPSPCV